MLLAKLVFSVAASVIFAMGLVMIFNTSSAEVLDHALDISTHQALFKQIAFAMLGCLLARGFYLVGYEACIKLSLPLLLGLTGFLALVFVPGVGVSANGARRWVGFLGFTVQPSEFAKVFMPLFFIHCVMKPDISCRRFLEAVSVSLIPLFLIAMEPDNGTCAVIVVVVMGAFFLCRVPLKYWAVPVLAFSLVGGAVASQLPYVKGRLKVYFNPELDIRGKGHQPHQAKIAAGAGGLLGRGPGQSLQKWSYLPEAQNDYIAAIYAEEFGFLGILALILAYLIMASAGFHIAQTAKDLQGFYLAGILTFLLSLQAFLNLGVVSGLLPSTGLNLPIFSQGGSSLMANLIALGLILSVKEKGVMLVSR